MMQHRFWLLILLGWGATAALPAQIVPTDTAWTLDGQAAEWAAQAQEVASGWAWAAAHDGEMLYIGLRIPELQQQQQIQICGFTLWLYPAGKKRHSRGITFPLGMPEELRPADTETLEFYRTERSWCPPLPAQPGLELHHFYGKGDPVWGEAFNPGGLSVVMACDSQGQLIYEAAIPLAVLPSLEDGEGTLSLAFESGALGRPTDLRGTDAAAGAYGINGQRDSWATEAARQRQNRLDRYRAFASPLRLRLRGLKLVSGKG